MALHLQREIESLKRKILKLSDYVEESIEAAVIAVENKDDELARKVIESDKSIDAFEIEVEEDCLKTLALHQPVATDLRFIIAVLKINNDLERIGDLAVNIAERSLSINKSFVFSGSLISMMEKVLAMLKKCLDALVKLDLNLAISVCASDDEIDNLYRELFDKIKKGIKDEPHKLEDYLHIISIARHLERVADHATNISEDIVYMIEGKIMRHHGEDFKKN